MTVTYKDFVPPRRINPEFPGIAQYGTFAEAVIAANEFIAEKGITPLNVETVTLPNIWNRREDGTEDGGIRIEDDQLMYWHQFVRVWYVAAG